MKLRRIVATLSLPFLGMTLIAIIAAGCATRKPDGDQSRMTILEAMTTAPSSDSKPVQISLEKFHAMELEYWKTPAQPGPKKSLYAMAGGRDLLSVDQLAAMLAFDKHFNLHFYETLQAKPTAAQLRQMNDEYYEQFMKLLTPAQIEQGREAVRNAIPTNAQLKQEVICQKREACASNMRQIGIALILYSDAHNGKFPPDLGALVAEQGLKPEVFLCPAEHSDVKAADKIDPKLQPSWVNANADYVYIGAGKHFGLGNPNAVVMYEKGIFHQSQGMNVLFADVHESFLNIADAKKAIHDSTPASKQ